MDTPQNSDETPPRLEDFQGEKPYCDVVMKGGITSGVVYPRAIVELAKRFQLKNIGGTSAGAIAAGVAAAAEFGRKTGGHARLLECADQIGTILLSLFQPARRLRPLLNALLATLGDRPWFFRLPSVLWQIVRGYWPWTFCGSLPAASLAVYAVLCMNHWIAWLAVAFSALLGIGILLTWRVHRALVVDLPGNYFGICSGLSRATRGGRPALTEWLSDELDRVAGMPLADDGTCSRPLTFGDLCGDDPEDIRINLQVMTTNLSEGRPYRIPFDERNTFMFRPDEFRDLFPQRIVDWMVENSGEVTGSPGYHWLPRTPDLPVIVALRMSLSFPLLLSAVPLYARDFRRATEQERQQPRRQWFSDGGISSNFPIHFFDDIWPSWPTFGIKLGEHREEVHGDQRVAMPKKAISGQLLEFRDIESTGQFLGGIVGAMQEWRDNLQSVLPGYRERIVQVRLAAEEGGMNLNMPVERIRQLSHYGELAGKEMCENFDWDGHRWRRFLVSVARLESLLADLGEAYAQGAPLDEGMQTFLQRYSSQPAEYKQTKEWNDAALGDIEDLLRCYESWLTRPSLRDGRIPKPEVDIRFTPRV